MKKYIKRFLFSLVITLSFCFVDTCLVNATSYNIIQKQGYYSTLGGKYFANINSYITIPRYSNNNLTMDFTFDISSFFQTIPDNTLTSEFDTLVNSNFATGYVVLDYCSTYGQLIDDVYSSYNNYMDLIHYVGTCQATTSNRGSAYRIYMRISPPSYTYTSSNSSTYLGYYNSVLHYTNNSEYDLVIRPLNLILYDSENYNSLLDKARESAKNQTQIDQNQTIINQNNQVINGQNQINDTLIDDSAPSNLDSLSNAAGWLPPGPVDGILNLPLSFLTNLNTNLSKSCKPVDLPLPFVDKTLPLPCVSSLYAEIEGLPAWINTIGIIASAFILFGYLINLYKYVDDTLTFRENNYIDNWSGV